MFKISSICRIEDKYSVKRSLVWWKQHFLNGQTASLILETEIETGPVRDLNQVVLFWLFRQKQVN